MQLNIKNDPLCFQADSPGIFCYDISTAVLKNSSELVAALSSWFILCTTCWHLQNLVQGYIHYSPYIFFFQKPGAVLLYGVFCYTACTAVGSEFQLCVFLPLCHPSFADLVKCCSELLYLSSAFPEFHFPCGFSILCSSSESIFLLCFTSDITFFFFLEITQTV